MFRFSSLWRLSWCLLTWAIYSDVVVVLYHSSRRLVLLHTGLWYITCLDLVSVFVQRVLNRGCFYQALTVFVSLFLFQMVYISLLNSRPNLLHYFIRNYFAHHVCCCLWCFAISFLSVIFLVVRHYLRLCAVSYSLVVGFFNDFVCHFECYNWCVITPCECSYFILYRRCVHLDYLFFCVFSISTLYSPVILYDSPWSVSSFIDFGFVLMGKLCLNLYSLPHLIRFSLITAAQNFFFFISVLFKAFFAAGYSKFQISLFVWCVFITRFS